MILIQSIGFLLVIQFAMSQAPLDGSSSNDPYGKVAGHPDQCYSIGPVSATTVNCIAVCNDGTRIVGSQGTTKLCFGGGNDPCQECETSVLAQAYNTCGKDMYIEFMFYPTSEECQNFDNAILTPSKQLFSESLKSTDLSIVAAAKEDLHDTSCTCTSIVDKVIRFLLGKVISEELINEPLCEFAADQLASDMIGVLKLCDKNKQKGGIFSFLTGKFCDYVIDPAKNIVKLPIVNLCNSALSAIKQLFQIDLATQFQSAKSVVLKLEEDIVKKTQEVTCGTLLCADGASETQTCQSRPQIVQAITKTVLFVATEACQVITEVVQLVQQVTGTGNGTNGTKGSSCFALNSTVHLSSGQAVLIKDLKAGDEVMTWNPETKRIFPTKVIANFHLDKFTVVQFMKIQTESSQILMTPSHFIFRINETTMNPVPTFAAHLKEQDILLQIISTQVDFQKVQSVTALTLQGAANPVTMDGTLIVNGYYVSCYATVGSHFLGHVGLMPFRMFDNFANCFGKYDRDYSNQIQVYSDFWIQMLQYAIKVGLFDESSFFQAEPKQSE